MKSSQNLDNVVANALAFVKLSQKNNENGEKSKGEKLAEKRRRLLEEQLKATKESVAKQTLLSRSLASSLVQHEKVEQALKGHIKDKVHQNRLITSLHEDRKLFDQLQKPEIQHNGSQRLEVVYDASFLSVIELKIGLSPVVALLLQHELSSYNDELFCSTLATIPKKLMENMNAELFCNVAVQTSQKMISNKEARLIFDDVYHRQIGNTNDSLGSRDVKGHLLTVDPTTNASLWEFLCAALRRKMLTLFLAKQIILHNKRASLISDSKLTLSSTRISSSAAHDGEFMSKSLNELRLSTSQQSSPRKTAYSQAKLHSQLKNQLTQSKSRIHNLSSKIVTNLTAVSQGLAFDGETHTTAAKFAKHIGARKMVIVFEGKATRLTRMTFQYWKSIAKLLRTQMQCNQCLRALGVYRLFRLLSQRNAGKLGRGLQRFSEAKKWFRDMEKLAAIGEIQRAMRGGNVRLRNRKHRKEQCAIRIQKTARGRIARRSVKDLKYQANIKRAVIVVENAWYKQSLLRTMKRLRILKYRTKMAVAIQRVFRGHKKRELCNQLRLQQRRLLAAIRFQCLWRKYRAVIRVDYKRFMERKVLCAVAIQCAVRKMIAKEVFASKLRLHNAAKVIQYAMLCFFARRICKKRLQHKMAIKIQKTARGRLGKKRFAFFKRRRDNSEQMRKDAIEELKPLIQGYRSRRKVLPKLKEFRKRRTAATNVIKKILRAVLLGQKARIRVQRIRIEEADRIAKTQLKYKAIIIQRVVRGGLGRIRVSKLRKAYLDALERKNARIPPYYRLKNEFYQQLNLFCRPYAIRIQCFVRCRKARIVVRARREIIASKRIARAWAVYLAIKDAKELLRQKRRRKELEIKSATILQKRARGVIARYEFGKHDKAGIVKWFIRELRATGLIGKALINFRLRKRQLEITKRLATRIQALARRYNTRKWFLLSKKRLTREMKARIKARRDLACARIQGMGRMFFAKKYVTKVRQDREEENLLKAMMEELDGRLEDMHGDWMKDLLAIRAQTGIRGVLAKNEVARKQKALEGEKYAAEKRRRDLSAAKIQSLARGVQGRKKFKKLRPTLQKRLQMRNICVECENKVAVRRCKDCNDRYCELCFINIHKKGNRKGHIWTPIHTLHGQTDVAPVATEQVVAFQKPAKVESEWEEYYDANAKAKYWFNKLTGEASWIPPPKKGK